MKHLFILSLLLVCIQVNAQTTNSVFSFSLEFYLDDKKKSIEELNIQVIQSSTLPDGFDYGNGVEDSVDSNKKIDSLPRGTNLLHKITADSVFVYNSTGSFKIVLNYRGSSDTISESFDYFRHGGRVVIGVIKDARSFRKLNYSKFKLLDLYKEEKEKLEDKYPYLIVSEYCPSESFNSILYIATKMNTSYGSGTWWGTQITSIEAKK